MPKLLVPVLTALLAIAVVPGDAIKCFVCNSDRDYTCGDPFQYAHLPLTECDRISGQQQSYTGSRSICVKTKTYANGRYVVDRGCSVESNYGGQDPCAAYSGASSSNYGGGSFASPGYDNNAYGGGNSNGYGGSNNGYNSGSNNAYGRGSYGGGRSGYGASVECSTCRYDACNGAAGFVPGFWTVAALSAISFISVKYLF